MSDAGADRDLTLIIVRHSQAEDPAAFAATGAPDCERPLTPQGVKRMKRAARRMAEWLDGVDRILTSPCTRAEHTARILADELGRARVESFAELTPGAEPEALSRWLEGEVGSGCVVLVGHEPDLSHLIAWLCGAVSVEMKKGAACALHFDGPPAKGSGTLIWLLPQSLLRNL
ncbi:phosphohistidine phosphatase SixA [Thioalkalivibrio denitrificans]|uniref:Phosphohistidine phosphatase SixA n=1 Tax=Thioalkalivibrio denitrificans TaxID=108003 RepID=A0A1V3NP20_9GAMM|nr:phosphohistidine phosphatase SixA [Thioalkalivibrio denitrificans]OOG26800.1 phosphohistidine phosphatase SixA [Thioalkalivibrio denitrificans]